MKSGLRRRQRWVQSAESQRFAVTETHRNDEWLWGLCKRSTAMLRIILRITLYLRWDVRFLWNKLDGVANINDARCKWTSGVSVQWYGLQNGSISVWPGPLDICGDAWWPRPMSEKYFESSAGRLMKSSPRKRGNGFPVRTKISLLDSYLGATRRIKRDYYYAWYLFIHRPTSFIIPSSFEFPIMHFYLLAVAVSSVWHRLLQCLPISTVDRRRNLTPGG